MSRWLDGDALGRSQRKETIRRFSERRFDLPPNGRIFKASPPTAHTHIDQSRCSSTPVLLGARVRSSVVVLCLQSSALITAADNSAHCSASPEVQAEAARRCSGVAMVTRQQVHQHACLVLDASEDTLMLRLLNKSFYFPLTWQRLLSDQRHVSVSASWLPCRRAALFCSAGSILAQASLRTFVLQEHKRLRWQLRLLLFLGRKSRTNWFSWTSTSLLLALAGLGLVSVPERLIRTRDGRKKTRSQTNKQTYWDQSAGPAGSGWTNQNPEQLEQRSGVGPLQPGSARFHTAPEPPQTSV